MAMPITPFSQVPELTSVVEESTNNLLKVTHGGVDVNLIFKSQSFLNELCGEILATLELNYRNRAIITSNPETDHNFRQCLLRWKKAYAHMRIQ